MKPTRLGLWLVTGWGVFGLLPAAFDAALPAWYGLGIALAAYFAVTAVLVRRVPVPEFERIVPGSMALGHTARVRIVIRNPTARPVRLTLFDHHPAHLEPASEATKTLPRPVAIGPRRQETISYEVRPVRRGVQTFGRVQVAIQPRWSPWVRDTYRGEPQSTRVFPDFAAVAQFALLSAEHRSSTVGSRRVRRRGEGMDFHQLREFRDGDVLRQIDWKATARRRQLISREYQEERDQQVVFLLDCGRQMAARDGDLSHFDHALNAMLLLAWVALRQGDSVGLMTHSGQNRWVPPVKGAHGVTALLEQSFDLEPTRAPSDYLEGAEQILKRLPRRALVLWLTNLRDESEGGLGDALTLLRRRHLVLVASLKERITSEILQRSVTTLDDALLHGATHQYLSSRQRLRASIAARANMVLDVTAQELPGALVSAYEEIKRQGRL